MKVKKSGAGTTVLVKNCKVCECEFETRWPSQVYCSDKCKFGTFKCRECKKDFVPTQRQKKKREFCSPECWYTHYDKVGRIQHTCPNCGKEFHGKNNRKFCSNECHYESKRKTTTAECLHCEKEFPVANYQKNRKYCSVSCSNKARGYLPNGTKRKNSDGYVMIKVDNKWKFEHRVIMEEHLGMKLKKSDHVHHINGIRHDNRLKNLELWGKPHPSGIRNKDKIMAKVLKSLQLTGKQQFSVDDIRKAFDNA